ncbi:glycosyl transferase family 2 [Bacteroidia bacterium]|nr:glycosyl transferase family 2 [Bacteroidia bacterium]
MEIFTTVEIILLSALACCWIVQLIYYWCYLASPYFYQRAVQKGKITLPSNQPPVSVIICAKNEARNLEQYLPSILEQDYPEYEVIFVNSGSNDDTDDVMKRLDYQYPRLYHTYIPDGTKNLGRKKLSLTVGIKAAHYDTLLFTEADCRPVGKDWIRRMARHFTDKKSIVLGFSTLEKSSSAYAAYDYFFSDLQMVALTLKGHAYQADNRNYAYHKQHFFQEKGFVRSNFLDAGENDLFIEDIASNKNVAVELTPESVIQVDMNENFVWKELKIRRMLTRRFYETFPLLFWRGEQLTRILFYLLAVAVIVAGLPDLVLPAAALFFFLTRLYTQYFVINKTASALNLRKFYVTLFFFDCIQVFVDGYFYLYQRLRGKKDYNWKYEKR